MLSLCIETWRNLYSRTLPIIERNIVALCFIGNLILVTKVFRNREQACLAFSSLSFIAIVKLLLAAIWSSLILLSVTHCAWFYGEGGCCDMFGFFT